jgi:hypothetical protein
MRREKRRPRHAQPAQPLTLLTRRQVAQRWGVHVGTVYRMELAGTLQPVCLTDSRTAMKFFPIAQIEAIEAGNAR